jgi:hypothetical protein
MLKKYFIEAPVFTVFLFAQLPFLGALILIGHWIKAGYTSETLTAFLIVLVFVGGAMWVWGRFWAISSQNFIKIYYASTLARFFMVILLLFITLSSIKFDQMFFTVNFIISYLYQSVIELLLIHHRLLKHPLEE